MPCCDVGVLKICEPLASSLAGFPKKVRGAVRRAGTRDQHLSFVVVVVVFCAVERKVFEECDDVCLKRLGEGRAWDHLKGICGFSKSDASCPSSLIFLAS